MRRDDDEEAAERRQAARDEWLADQDFDRRLHEHNCGKCDSDNCRFCLAQEVDDMAIYIDEQLKRVGEK